jgi:hypothetical protein
MNTPCPWVIIGNPENRRVSLFQQALARCGHPPASVLSYYGLLTGQETIESIPDDAIVRIESPGENFAVEKLLLAAGIERAALESSPVATREELRELAEDRGLIFHPRQWYLGFISSWTNWFESAPLKAARAVTTTACDLQIIFDKLLCHGACSSVGLPVPTALSGVQCWDELVERLRDSALERVFVKLANGSSASGVVALHVCRDFVEAITSVELIRCQGEVHLYNSLKIRRYTSLDDVRDLINALTPHHVQVEQWLPKAAVGGRVCDLRVIVIGGEPRHIVVRTSRTPITNLHLGNRRGDLQETLAKISDAALANLNDTCHRCAKRFPNSLHLALDILFTPGFRRHYLLEVNAFGDLLPGVEHQGRDTYHAQIEALVGVKQTA